MEISCDRSFIFVHVYRVGGQSISAALRPHCVVPDPPRLARVPVLRKLASGRSLYALRERNHGHITARELRDALPAEVFEGFFKFAFEILKHRLECSHHERQANEGQRDDDA